MRDEGGHVRFLLEILRQCGLLSRIRHVRYCVIRSSYKFSRVVEAESVAKSVICVAAQVDRTTNVAGDVAPVDFGL